MIKSASIWGFSLLFSITCFAQQTDSTHTNKPASVQVINLNEDIGKTIRDQVKSVNDKVVASFYNNDVQKLIPLFSDRLKAKYQSQAQPLVKQVHPFIKSNNYTLLDEYYITNTSTGQTAAFSKEAEQDNAYQVNYEVFSRETYVSLLVFRGSITDFLITCVYGKYNDEWKLDVILIGPYKILGKTPVELYRKAQTAYKANDLVDAFNIMNVAEQITSPAKKEFVYAKSAEMKTFQDKVEGELKIKYPIPFTISQVKALPQIIGVRPVVLKDGIYPSVMYLTKTPLKDTIALKEENDQIKKVIGEIFPGIDKNKYVFLKAYNQVPNSKTSVETYGFVLKSPKTDKK